MAFFDRIAELIALRDSNRTVDPQAPVREEDVLLEFEERSASPTRRGNRRLRLLRDGRVQSQRNDAEPAGGAEWCEPYPLAPEKVLSDPAGYLGRVLPRHQFLELPERVEGPPVSGGYWRILAVRDGAKLHTVRRRGAGEAHFARLVETLLHDLLSA